MSVGVILITMQIEKINDRGVCLPFTKMSAIAEIFIFGTKLTKIFQFKIPIKILLGAKNLSIE